MISIKKFSAILLCLFAGMANAQDKVNLEYRFENGKSYRYEMVSSNSFIQEMMGQENKGTAGIRQAGVFSIDATEPDGLMHGTFTWESFSTSTKMMQIDTTIEMKDYPGKKSSFLLSPKGELIITESDSADVMTGMPRSPVNTMLSFYKLPERLVSVGDTFSVHSTDTTYDQKNNQTITERNRKAKLESVEKSAGGTFVYIISYEEQVSSSGNVETMGMEMYQETEGTEKGTVRISGNGILISQQSVSDKDMTMLLTGQMGMTIPMTIHEEKEYRLID
jgi:hypothetical protein